MTNGRTGAVLEHRERRTEGQDIVMSEDMVGKKVTNPDGYTLGEIASLRVNLHMSRVEYAVLRHGGVLGMGRKYFAIPLEAIIYRPGDDVYVVNIDRETLDNQRGFTEGNWPYEADWSLIRSSRPLAPPRLDEARAVSQRMEAMPEVITTERTEVVSRPPPGVPILEEKPAPTEVREGPVVQEQPLEKRQVPAEKVEEATMERPPEATEERLVTEARAYGPPTAVEEAPGEKTVIEERGVPEIKRYGPPPPEGEEIVVEKTVVEEQVVETFPETREAAVPEIRETTVPEIREYPERPEGETKYMSSTELLTFLAGTDYPADKQTLLAHARRNRAPATAITALERFEEKKYYSPMEVSREYDRQK